MKRIALLGLVLLLLVFSAALVALLASPDPIRPQFKRPWSPAAVQQVSYDFLGPRPFEGGKLWIQASSGGTNWETYFYDIEKRQVLGQLIRGDPVMVFGDPPRLLCAQQLSARNKMKERLASLIARISRGRINFPSPQTEILRYWLLNLENNEATRIGEIPATQNFSFFPSPDYHFAYTGRHNNRGGIDFFCIDLKRGSIKKLDTGDWASGWWDNTHVLFQTTNVDFVLYDVATKATSPLMTFAPMAAFLQEKGISEDPTKARAFFSWNGRENDFYLTGAHQRWLAAESFLIKVERPDGKLRLVSPRFKFEWSDHFDPTGRYYLYSGREAGSGSDGVFVRDLRDGTTNVLVTPDSNRYFSIPRFYGDSVIYIRSNALWRINLDGPNNIRLFPPPETVEEPAFQHPGIRRKK